MTLPELRPRLPLAGVALAALAGIALADLRETALAWDVAGLILLAAWAALRPRTVWGWLFIAGAFFNLHTAQYFGSEARRLAESFQAGPQAVRVSGIVWSAPQTPQKWSPFVTCRFLMKLESIEIGGMPSPANALVQVRWSGDVPAYGDRVALLGTAESLEGARNPGQFDYAAHERRAGVYSQVSARYKTDCRILGHGCGQTAQVFAFAAQRWIRSRLESGLEDAPQAVALIDSMVLGIQETLRRIKDLFQKTGTVHLFAVSGLTVGMVGSILWFVLKTLRA